VPRPLYGLDALADRPAAPVVLCEGEKAAEAAWDLMPDAVGLTWPGGSKATDKADFSPLEGRDVILWADADEPGREAMKTAAKLARKAGAASVRWLNLPALAAARGRGELPQGFDAADLLAEGWDAGRLAEFMARPDALLDAKTAAPAAERPAANDADAKRTRHRAERFTVTPDGFL
jgi:putative DNA primase/helicase